MLFLATFIKHITFSLICLFPITGLVAQKIEEGYDINFKPSTSGIRYYVITEKKDDLWYREAYYLPERTIAMAGWYKDKECKTAEGSVTWFYTNNNPKSIINYKNGKEDGMALRFHENGMMSDSSTYLNGYRKGISLGWDEEGNQADSSNFDGNGNGVVVKWYENGVVYFAGRIINDTTKVNRWTYYHPNGKVMATEDYVNGKVVQRACLDENGRQLDSTLCADKEAQFQGNETAWKNFLAKNLNPNVPVDNRAPEGTYTVVIQFVVDKDGQVTDLKPLTKFGYGMEDEVLRILRKSPRWVPAMQFGRPVKAYRKQPVTFLVARN